MRHLLDPTCDLESWLADNGQPGYRAAQLRQWIYQKRAGSFQGMENVPKSLRTQLDEEFQIWTTQVVRHQQAEDGTEKLLLSLADRGTMECVLLRDGMRRTICVSSQVGCAMGCVFCASGLNGVQRNLTCGEIVEQMLRLQQLLETGERLSHVVVMGMGEPLANLDALLPSLQIASHQDGLGISTRRITISTVGLPKAIQRLVELKTGYHLAVSLHAPDDSLRNQLVPVNKNIGLHQILSASDKYFEASGRRLTFEYVLLSELNDREHHAQKLARLLEGRSALVNLIPYNPVAGLPYRCPTTKAVGRFREILQQHGLNVQVRQRKGDEIQAACGQLRRENLQIIDKPAADNQ